LIEKVTDVSTISVLSFGFLLGLKHAVEADHVAAVSTIASESPGILSSSFVGALWGLGHTISLLMAGAAIVFLHFEISHQLSLVLEFVVGLMLIALGANALRKLLRGGHIHMHVHQHGGRLHTHPHIHDGKPEQNIPNHHGLKLQRRPIVVGMIHGLAGSGALMLLVLSTIRHPVAALAYILVFGVGSTGGMMMMSALIGLPARLTARRFRWANTILRGAASVFSVVLGLFIAYDIGFRKLMS
jgi:high-affinity nickel-transport protein